MMTHAMNCEAFDERLADYLEGELPPSERRAFEAHVASCVRCTALLRDLEGIRADAGALPELTPSRDLWHGIAERIEAPVIAFATPRATPTAAPAHRHRALSRMRLAAVAAALVAVTAGVTYTLTIIGQGDRNGASLAEQTTSTDTGNTLTITAPAKTDVAAGNPDLLRQSDTMSVPGAVTQNVRNETVPTPATHSREIDQLRDTFARNRNRLDPRTAAIIEANLKVIDEAIAQSKAALAQDPASGFLNEQLNNALDKKLELLRTAALLPQRT